MKFAKLLMLHQRYWTHKELRTLLENIFFLFANRLNEENREEFQYAVFYRLHNVCTEFYKIQYRLSENKSDITAAAKIPKTKLKKKSCHQFLEHSSFYSLEVNGDIIKSVLKDGIWIQTFKDNTNTRLHFKWLSDCEFELEFIESTNFARAKFSRTGDKYRYIILNKERTHYFMSVEIEGNSAKMTFKLYFNPTSQEIN